MAETSGGVDPLHLEYHKKAKEIEEKGPKVKGDMARFNQSHDGLNPDVVPVDNTVLIPDSTPSQRLLDEVSSSELLEDPQTGQKFNAIRANWINNPEKLRETPVTVYMPLFMNEIEKTESHERIVQLAHAMSDFPFLTFDHPNMGNSDPRTEGQSSTSKDDSYFEIANAQLRIMEGLGIKKINLVGQSFGSFADLAIAVRAAEHGIEIENMVLAESPGVKHLTLLQLGLIEAREAKSLDLYHSHPFNERMFKASQLDQPDEDRIKSNTELLSDVRDNDPGLAYSRSMTKRTVEDRLLQAIDTQPGLKQVVFINGGESKISPPKKIRKIIDRVKEKRPDMTAKLRQMIFSGEGHLAMAHAQRFASTTKLAITGRPF